MMKDLFLFQFKNTYFFFLECFFFNFNLGVDRIVRITIHYVLFTIVHNIINFTVLYFTVNFTDFTFSYRICWHLEILKNSPHVYYWFIWMWSHQITQLVHTFRYENIAKNLWIQCFEKFFEIVLFYYTITDLLVFSTVFYFFPFIKMYVFVDLM